MINSVTIQEGCSARWMMFGLVAPKLNLIFWDLCGVNYNNGVNTMITSIIRPRTTDSGIHEAKRAIDFVLTGVNNYTLPFGESHQKLLDYCNDKYIYRPQSQILTLMWHQANVEGPLSGYHFHLQVSAT